MGLGTNFSGSFSVNGGTVSYDTATDTLTTLADKIKALGVSGLSAGVVTVADANGKSTQRLQVTGASGAPTFGSDTNGLLQMTGILQQEAATSSMDETAAKVLSTAKDSQFTLDGLAVRRAGNTVSDALAGVTLNLLKEGMGATTTLTLSRDTQTAVDAVGKFVSAYNDAKGKIKAQSTYAPGTDASATPPLFGDWTLQQIGDDLASAISRTMTGLPAGFGSLRDIGIKLETSGALSVDNAALAAAVQKDPGSIAKLFSTFGQASNAAVSFVSAKSETKEGTYDVVITAPAEQAKITAGSAPGLRLTTETLRFSGALFATEKTVPLDPADTLAQVITKINGSEAGKQVTAFDDGGRLGLRSNGYGSAQSFSVVSDLATGGAGIGTVALSDAGVDVAGTIGGETAGGSGQNLTGNQAAGAANGLIVKVTALAAGSYGTVSFQRGAAAASVGLVGRLTDITSGAVKRAQDTITQKINDSKESVTAATARVDAYIARLQAQFTRMESQISRFKAQSTQLSQQIAGLSGLNK
jgi:flagellar hook-associated protein 2